MKQQSEIQFNYLGKPYPVKIQVDPFIKKLTIQWDGDSFLCTSPIEGEIDIADALQSFYLKSCRKLIEGRLKLYQTSVKVKYKSFSVENHPTKWGSCTSKKHLTFHWQLIMYPLHAIDYVVVHELCHLVHMNHDRSFWRLVGKIVPKYKEAMALLGTEKTREL